MSQKRRHDRKARKRSAPRGKQSQSEIKELGDGAIYFLFIFLGLAVGGFVWMVKGSELSIPILAGYVIAILFLINLSAFRIIAGATIPGWQRSLARLPLRFAGFGTRGGKPVEAAQGDAGAKSLAIGSAVVSVVLAGVLLAGVGGAFS